MRDYMQAQESGKGGGGALFSVNWNLHSSISRKNCPKASPPPTLQLFPTGLICSWNNSDICIYTVAYLSECSRREFPPIWSSGSLVSRTALVSDVSSEETDWHCSSSASRDWPNRTFWCEVLFFSTQTEWPLRHSGNLRAGLSIEWTSSMTNG